MLRTRVIPCLLLKDNGLIKTVQFKNPTYIGDPLNAVKIFNDKEVDELIILDTTATAEKRKPNFKLIEEIAGECFMPLAYGGGVRCVEDIRAVLSLGVEKIVINSYAVERPEFIREASDRFGSQSIVVALDAKRNFLKKYELYIHGGRTGTGLVPELFAEKAEALGAGEIFLNSIDRDGTQTGYDLDLILKVSSKLKIPVVASGGAGGLQDLRRAVQEGGAAAAAAGSLFVFQGKYRAVMINFPSPQDLSGIFSGVS